MFINIVYKHIATIMKHYIFIDGSYFIFYRLFALKIWWKNAHPEEPLSENIEENAEFIEKFRTTFISKIENIVEQFSIKKSTRKNAKKQLNPCIAIDTEKDSVHLFVGKDMPRHTLWRSSIFPEYKGTRDHGISTIQKKLQSFLFNLVYEEKLFEQAGIPTILSYDGLEADDCIALSTKCILEQQNDTSTPHIWIITSDMDYLQLAHPQVHIYDLKFKCLTDNKKWSGDPKRDLFCKIVMGDKSDNIPSIFKKCGIKTSFKCYDDSEFFESKKQKEPQSVELFDRNQTIIDFNKIPKPLQQGFFQRYRSILIE